MLRAKTSKAFVVLAGAIFFFHTTYAQARKTISRAELKDILAHSITILALNEYCKTADGFYPGSNLRIVDDAELNSNPGSNAVHALLKEDLRADRPIARYSEMLRLIRKLRPRMITDAVTHWGAWDWHVHLNRCRATVADLKATDSSLVVQASLNEFADRGTANAIGTIPSWVWEAFGLPDEHRPFDIYRMMYADWRSEKTGDIPQRWWSDYGTTNGLPNALIPDISTLEAKMWFYYQGRTFIDMGCESIQFSQVELMNNVGYDPAHFAVVFDKLRAYADTKANIRYLLFTGHTTGMRDAGGRLLFDFHTGPARPAETGANVDANGGDCHITAKSCGWSTAGKLYGRSLGGQTPSGWWCDALPGLVFIDNYGANGPPSGWGKPAGGDCDVYHFDEITWFALQDKAYRDHWLRYAYNRAHALDTNLYFALPVKRGPTTREYWYPADYLANNPKPGLLDAPATIYNIPGGDVDRDALQLYAGYGQEDVIQQILLAGPDRVEPLAELQVSPNPAGTWVDILLTQPGPGSRMNYALTSTVGARAAGGDFHGTTHRVDVSALPRGLYVLSVWDGAVRHAAKLLLR